MILLQEIYNEVLTEGLIWTVDITIAIPILRRNGYPSSGAETIDPTQAHFHPLPVHNIINVYLERSNKEITEDNIKRLKQLLNNLGWYIALAHYWDDWESEPEGGNNIEQTIKYAIENDVYLLKLDCDAKYDIPVDIKKMIEDGIDKLYHITPKQAYETKIKKIGLVPKSKDKKFSYPSRIYLGSAIESVQHLASQLSDYEQRRYMSSNIKFSILEIDLNKLKSSTRFFHDPRYSGLGVYTVDNIPPSAIKEVEVIDA